MKTIIKYKKPILYFCIAFIILTVTRIPESSIKFEIAHDFGSKAEYIEGTFRSDTDSTVILDLMRIIEDAKIQCEVCQVV